jgi:hypothetical protein
VLTIKHGGGAKPNMYLADIVYSESGLFEMKDRYGQLLAFE